MNVGRQFLFEKNERNYKTINYLRDKMLTNSTYFLCHKIISFISDNSYFFIDQTTTIY